MKILTAKQVHQLDAHTIEHEPIPSIDLMERASRRFTECFIKHHPEKDQDICIFAGTGNNGGDALAIARLLFEAGYTTRVVWCKISDQPSKDCAINRQRLASHSNVELNEWKEGDPLEELPNGTLIIDGLFGSGLNRPVEGYWAKLLDQLNNMAARRVAIDIPSGVFADKRTRSISLHAHETYTFQLPKLAFFFPENEVRVGDWQVLDIGLSREFIGNAVTRNHFLERGFARQLLRGRERYGHKGTYGHALLIMGSQGSIGAAILAGKACYRSGAGLVTIHAPQCGYEILQISLPEAMVSIDRHKYHFSEVPPLQRYSALGVGCGLGQRMTTVAAIQQLLERADKPLVLDADALNIISRDPKLLERVPKGSILTPHPKEFERLFGTMPDDFSTNTLQRLKAEELRCTIILKRAHTCIAFPDGTCYFNASGNPGMGTGGSGDVLTGMLTGLLAQGYPSGHAALLGVYLHGLAGDLAAADLGQESVLAGDIVRHIGPAYLTLRESGHA